MSTTIQHSGIVDSVAAGVVRVRILQSSACGACKVAAHCRTAVADGEDAAGAKVKFVDVRTADATAYAAGQAVTVSLSAATAWRALLLGFGLPLLLLMAVLFGVLRSTADEGLAALSGVGVLIPYYILLYVQRGRLERRFAFSIG